MEHYYQKPDFQTFMRVMDEFPTTENGWKLDYQGEIERSDFPGKL